MGPFLVPSAGVPVVYSGVPDPQSPSRVLFAKKSSNVFINYIMITVYQTSCEVKKKICTFCIYFSPSGTFVVEFCSFVLVPSVELWRVLRRGGRRRFWAGGTLKHSHMVRLRRFHHRNGVCARPEHWRQRSPGGAPVLPFEGGCNNAIVSALNSSNIIG